MRIYLFHRNRIFCDCLVTVLNDLGRFDARAIDPTCESQLTEALSHAGDSVFLVDLHLATAEATAIVGQIRAASADARVVLMLGSNDNNYDIIDYISMGINGCVLEEGSLEELQSGIERVVQGESFFSPRIIDFLFRRLATLTAEYEAPSSVAEPVPGDHVDLTLREKDILTLIELGLSNKQIAKKLSISIYTVKNHVHNILEKLQVADRFEAVRYVRSHGSI